MPTHRSSAGDPARTLQLLWRRTGSATPTRGPRPGLDIDRIVATAIGVADGAGLEAVTMRRVAQELGVAAMSLYTYVPGKAELLDLMLDTLYQQMRRVEPAEPHWRARLTAIARDNRELYDQHPWLVEISTGRPPLGPGVMAKYEHELSAFDGLGLDDVEVDAALTFVLGFVETYARAAASIRAAAAESAMTDRQWWEENEPLLAQVLDPERYPRAARVGSAAGAAYDGAHDPQYAFEFGLQRVLDGLGVLIERRAPRGSGQS